MEIGDVVRLGAARSTISSAGQKKIETTLKNSNLKSLWLPKCPVTDGVVDAVCSFVEQNKTMTHLRMEEATFSDVGLSRILKSLCLNTTLGYMWLRKCPVTDGVVDAICRFVEQNKTMRYLRMHEATFSNVGLSQILKSLCLNTKLESMMLPKCAVTDGVVDAICSFVEQNKTMTYLTTNKAVFSDSGLSRLLQALSPNSALIDLSLWHWHMSDGVVDVICELIRQNPKMTQLRLDTDTYTDAHLSILAWTLGASSTLRSILSVEKGQDPCVQVTRSDEEDPSFYYFVKVNDQLKLLPEQVYLQVTQVCTDTARFRPAATTATDASTSTDAATSTDAPTATATAAAAATATAAAAVTATKKGTPQHTPRKRNEPLPEEVKAMLDRNRVNLVMSIVPGSLYPYLRQGNTLTEDEEEHIRLNSTRAQQVSRILDHLKRRSLQDYETFKQALVATNQEHVVEEILCPDTSAH